MKKTHIIIIAIIAVVFLTGIIILVQNKAKKNDAENVNENVIVADSDSDIAVSNNFSDKVNVTIGAVSGVGGSVVTVPVSFDTITESGVGGCNFSIEYDNTKVEVDEVLAGEIIGSKDNLEYSLSDSKGIISFLFAGENERDAITQAGTFAYVKFRINENAASGEYALTSGSDISFGDSVLERIEYSFKNGKINVK